MAAPPVLSVVIPTRDGRARLEECLPPLLEDLHRGPPWEVIVVDDGSREPLQVRWPEVLVVRQAGAGFSAAANAGARAARAPVVIFLNDDALVRAGWSAALLEALEADPGVVIAGGVAVHRDRPEITQSAGIRIARSGAGIDVGGEPLTSLGAAARDVTGVSGVSMAVRRDWFLAGGGFDERLRMYFQDVELSLRAWRDGHRVQLVPAAVVEHTAGATAGPAGTVRRHAGATRARLLIAARHMTGREFAVAVLLSLAQDAGVVTSLLAHGRARDAARAAAGKAAGTAAGLGAAARQRVRGPRPATPLQDLGVTDPLRVSARLWRHRRLTPGG